MSRPPEDPADHAEDFARREFSWIVYVVSQRMLDVGIAPEKIGTRDPKLGIGDAAFHPHERLGGGISPDGRFTVDSGLFNPALLDPLGSEASASWARAGLRDRLDAVVAHEYEEHLSGTHEGAVERARRYQKLLLIREKARQLLLKGVTCEKGEKRK